MRNTGSPTDGSLNGGSSGGEYNLLVDSSDAAAASSVFGASAPPAPAPALPVEPIVIGELTLDASGCYIQPAEHETTSPFTADTPIWPNIEVRDRGDVPDRAADLPSGSTLLELYAFLADGRLQGGERLTISGAFNTDLVGTQVRQGQIGLQTDNASRTNTYLYLPGCHTTYFQWTKSDITVSDINLSVATYIRLSGTDFHLIVIPPQHRGLALENGMPKELKAGIHVIKSNAFSFNPVNDVFDTTTVYVGKNTAHFFNIPPSKMCAISINNVNYTLGPGSYEFNVQNLRLLSDAGSLPNLSDAVFQNGTQHMMTVPQGKVALVQRDGRQMLYPAGKYFVNDPSMVRGQGRAAAVPFSPVRVDDKKGNYVSKVGPFTIITCGAGQIPMIYGAGGRLRIETENTFFTIREPATLSRFVDTNVKTLDIYDLDEEDAAESRAGGRAVDAVDDVHNKLVVRTRDGVRLEISAVLTYRVNGERNSLMKTVLVDDLSETLRRSALQELSAVYSRTPYFSDHKPVHKARRAKLEDDGDGEGALREGAQQASLRDLKRELDHHYGVEVLDFRIIDCVPLDQQLLDKAAEQQAASMEVDLASQNVERRLELAENEAAVKEAIATADAQAQAAALKISTQAQVDAMQATQAALKDMAPAAQQAYLMQQQAKAQVEVIKAMGMAMQAYAAAGGKVPAQLIVGGMPGMGMQAAAVPMSSMPMSMFPPQPPQQQQPQQLQQPSGAPGLSQRPADADKE